MTAQTWLLTYDDLLALPDDGKRYELIDGVLVEMPGPSWMHADIVGAFFTLLRVYVQSNFPGGKVLTAPVDVWLSEHRVVQPDILYVRPGRPSLFAQPPAVRGAPDLVIEVLSPSNPEHDLLTKYAIYEQAGVPEYWSADQAAAVMTVNVLRDGRYVEHPIVDGLATSEVLPGLQIDVAALFASLTESESI
jgi:Uma2 family endonuclease